MVHIKKKKKKNLKNKKNAPSDRGGDIASPKVTSCLKLQWTNINKSASGFTTWDLNNRLAMLSSVTENGEAKQNNLSFPFCIRTGCFRNTENNGLGNIHGLNL